MSSNQFDYSLVVLSPQEQKLFDLFKDSDKAFLTLEQFNILREKGLVNGSLGGKSDWFDNLPQQGICEISDRGKNLRAYQYNIKLKEWKDDKRYRITTGIAIAALIISIISILVSVFYH